MSLVGDTEFGISNNSEMSSIYRLDFEVTLT